MAFILAAILFLATKSCVESYTMSDFVSQTLSSCPGAFDCKSNSTGDRECDCDDDCVWKSTCCYDAPAYDEGLIKKFVDRDIRCTEGKNMLFGCHEGWGEDRVQMLCEAANPKSFSNSMDPLLHLPVISNETRIAYPNYYCAICNKDANDVFVMDYTFSCNGPPESVSVLQSTLQSVLDAGANGYDDSSVFGDEIYGDNNSTDEQYSVYNLRKTRMTGTNGLFISQQLNVSFDRVSRSWQPTLKFGSEHYDFMCETSIVRNGQCECNYHSSVIDKCDANWTDTEVEGLCRSFRGLVRIRLKAYRNIFCAICNFECIDDSCTPIRKYCYYGSNSFNSFTIVSGSSRPTIIKNHSKSTCKEDEDFFPGYCYGEENKLLCAISPAYHRTPICIKSNKEERVLSYLVHGQTLKSYTMSDFVNHTLSYCPGTFDCSNDNSFPRNCDCDDDCATRSTCCYDAPASYNKELIKKNIGKNKCVSGKLVFSECDEGWEDDEIRKMCKAADPDSFGNRKDDLILHLPVKSSETQTVYANYYCAVCNNDSTDIEEWDYRFACGYDSYSNDGFNSHELFRSTLQNILNKPTDAEENWANVVWADELRTIEHNEYTGYECRKDEYRDGKYWIIRFNDTYNEFLEESETAELRKVNVYCHLSLIPSSGYNCCQFTFQMIEKCDMNWIDSEVEELCQAFKGPVTIKGNTYRNVFCAICNHEFISPPDDLCYFQKICPPLPSPLYPLTFLSHVPSSLARQSKPNCKGNKNFHRAACRGSSFICNKSGAKHKNDFCVKRNN